MTQEPKLLELLTALGGELDWFGLSEPATEADVALAYLYFTADDVLLDANGKGTSHNYKMLRKFGAHARQKHPTPTKLNEESGQRLHRLMNAGGLLRLLGLDDFDRDVILGLIYVTATATIPKLVKEHGSQSAAKVAIRAYGTKIIADRERAKRLYDKQGIETPFLEKYKLGA